MEVQPPAGEILVRMSTLEDQNQNKKVKILIESYPLDTPTTHSHWRDLGVFTLGVVGAAVVVYITRERSIVDTMKTIAVNKIPTQGKWFPSFF